VLVDVPVYLPERETAEPEVRREAARPLAGVDRRGDAPGVVADPRDERLQPIASRRPTAFRYHRLLRSHVVGGRDRLGRRGERVAAIRIRVRGRLQIGRDPLDVDPTWVPVERVRGQPRLDRLFPLPARAVGVADQPVPVDEPNADRLAGALVAPEPVPAGHAPRRDDVPPGVGEAAEDLDRVAVGVRQARRADVAVPPVEVAQAVVEERDPAVTGRAPVAVEDRIEDEQREDPVRVRRGRGERGVVRDPEVLAVPDDGAGRVRRVDERPDRVPVRDRRVRRRVVVLARIHTHRRFGLSRHGPVGEGVGVDRVGAGAVPTEPPAVGATRKRRGEGQRV